MAHNGLWGEDQIGSEGAQIGVLNFYELMFSYTPLDLKPVALSVDVGRQKFSIGGVPKDYVMDDVLDAVVLNLDLRKFGRIRALALDFYTGSDLPDASFVRYVSGQQPVLGLRGDSFTLRSGLVYEQEGDNALVKGLMFKAYFFYADIGGGPIEETGADISYGGSLGNFSDNDWAAVYGARAGYTLALDEDAKVTVYAEGAQSTGIDRKEDVARDVELDGIAYGGGLVAEVKGLGGKLGASLEADFYHFDGGEYASDGLQFNHGFVGFKGRQVGGLNMDRFSGWHPSAFVGSGGVAHSPQNMERIAGTEFLHVGASVLLYDRLELSGDWWMFTDTTNTFLDPGALNTIDPPFGYSREEFAAEERFGKALGQEINGRLDLKLTEALSTYATYGIFTPGSYYDLRIDRVAGTSLGGPSVTDFWAANAGAVVKF